ncbi:hypothetical protein [Allomuricauda sp. d1]|uniref:hypothetical protein n=1 Tax=Allomuricauda sp. d1 TaxID=3136725 RepID=UPI0031CED100
MASLFTYRKFYDTPLRFFPLFIAYTFFNELLGYFILEFEEFSFFEDEAYHWHNIIIYNIYQIIFFFYLFWVYNKLLPKHVHQHIIKISALVYTLSVVISLCFQDPFHSSLFYADSLGCLAILLIIGLHTDKVTNGFSTAANRYNLMVWFNLGMVLFHLYFPLYILMGYLNVGFYLNYHLRPILWVVISIMYLLFTIGFIICRRRAFR